MNNKTFYKILKQKIKKHSKSKMIENKQLNSLSTLLSYNNSIQDYIKNTYSFNKKYLMQSLLYNILYTLAIKNNYIIKY